VAACRTRGHQIELKVGQGRVLRRGTQLHFEAASSNAGSAAAG